jgi:NAD(P)-dependent dehydrogenase (short-subunit alcohol dehydrogenase family)
VDSLTGLVAIVTGASRGFGRELSRQLAAENVRVVAAALPQEADALTALVEEISAAGGAAVWRPLDVRDPGQCSALVQWAVKEMGGLHILVNCAGLGHWVSVENTTDDQWQQMMEVNVSGAFYLSRAAIGPMRDAGMGHIVNIASVLGRRGVLNFSGYCASKAAVMAFSESLSKEVKGYGIQVTVVSPGTADTGFRDQHTGRPVDPSLTDPALMLQPIDVASAIVWALKASKHVASVQVVLEPLG